MPVPARCSPPFARCRALLLVGCGLLGSEVYAQPPERYEADEVARSLLNTGVVHEEGLQLHRWLTGQQPEPPVDSQEEVRAMIRVLAIGTAMTDSWIDALSVAGTSPADSAQARRLMAQAALAGASRCGLHQIHEWSADARSKQLAIERFEDDQPPADARIFDVQYRCITSYVSAHRVLARATVDLLKNGQRLAAGELITALEAAMQQDRHWPAASGGELQLASSADGRQWFEDGTVVQALTRLPSIDMARPVEPATQKAMFADFSAQTLEQPDPQELVTQILLWIPPVLRESLRSEVEAYVAAAALSPLQCQPVRAEFIDEERLRARIEAQCTVPALDAIAVPVMAATLSRDALEQHYRQVLGAMHASIGSAGRTTLTGFTTVDWRADAQRWALPVGAHAALQARALLPTPVVDEWGKPSNISRFLPAVLRVENIDPSALDEATRDKIQGMRLQMAEAMRGGWH